MILVLFPTKKVTSPTAEEKGGEQALGTVANNSRASRGHQREKAVS